MPSWAGHARHGVQSGDDHGGLTIAAPGRTRRAHARRSWIGDWRLAELM